MIRRETTRYESGGMENQVTAVFSTWFADDLLELLVQILLPLGQNLQPLSPHPLQVRLLHVSTHTHIRCSETHFWISQFTSETHSQSFVLVFPLRYKHCDARLSSEQLQSRLHQAV